jgi:two-component sensor histidine kinase
MRFFQPIGPLVKGWLLSLVAFGILAFLFVGQFAWMVSLPLGQALRIAARDWLCWALVTPLLFRLVGRLPLERGRWKVGLPVHLACALATIAFCGWWADSVFPMRGDFRGGPHPEFHTPHAPPSSIPPPGPRPDGPPPHGPQGTDHGPGPGGDHGPRPGPPGHFFAGLFSLGLRLPIYLALISSAHALYFYRRAQERERRALELTASLAQSRLEALKMQLQPHFLFNALNAIAALVHRDAEAADRMIGALSDLLRLTLETTGQQQLPLRRELEFVERYLAIEHVRFGDRLRFELDIAAETKEALVPAFLLQPLVENAVRHGLEPGSGNGLLTIRAVREGAVLHLSVTDNGCGLPEGKPPREGIGLSNTRARLHELYGEAAVLELRATNGLCVEITLPFHTTP